MNPHERYHRLIKAGKLANALLERHPSPESASAVAERMTSGEWTVLADKAGCNQPTVQTMLVVCQALRNMADPGQPVDDDELLRSLS